MPPDRDTQFVQTEMSEGKVDYLLESQGHGVVSLCADGEPYSLPLSYGYDGESVYFPFLLTGEEATKTDYIEAGSLVRFLVTDIRDLYNWRSVTVTDNVESVDPDGEEWDHFLDVLVRQDWFRAEFEEAASIESIQGWKLGAEASHGVERKTVAFE